MRVDQIELDSRRTVTHAPHPPARIFHLSFPADPMSVREALRSALARFVGQMTSEEAGTLELLLAEVLNNIVEHGYANSGDGTITLSIVKDVRGLNCSVMDDGPELPLSVFSHTDASEQAAPYADVDLDALPEGGFGWFLIRELAEDLGYRREDGRNLLAFRLALSGVGRHSAVA
ncbi:hypothetical protein BFP70_15055 [Thioclava sp. SK-1]|uniref:ATP-binding protein n=1 Tax=Thioclava sp. SK-1 TaxID=1889770 RepID=UPI0008259A2F|nr:ATP-binding protein [Thioclava sp. SK-1]OCX61625.1 hypothetical protein BFP70_15055 [Thioclava sp. SK-1]